MNFRDDTSDRPNPSAMCSCGLPLPMSLGIAMGPSQCLRCGPEMARQKAEREKEHLARVRRGEKPLGDDDGDDDDSEA